MPEVFFYEFGEFSFDAKTRRLFRSDNIVPLPAKAIEALEIFLKNHGKIIAKQDLIKTLWSDVVVSESNLTQTIYLLRKALGEKNDHFIENISKRGYRFTGEVVEKGKKKTEDVNNRPPSFSSLLNEKSIAVLPFHPLKNSDAEFEFLGAGLANAIISKLEGIEQLSIRPASSVRYFSTIEDGLVEIGKKLQARFLIEGDFLIESGNLCLKIQLIDVQNDITLWAETFEESLTDIFSLEEKIAAQIAAALELRLTKKQHDNLSVRQTDDSNAYQQYMKANYFRNLHTAEGFEKAFFHARRALEIEPDFALAHIEIAACFELLRLYGAIPAAEAVPQIKYALDKALSIDEHSAQALAILGSIKTFHDWEFNEAENVLKRAIELKPNNIEAFTVYNELLIALERFEEAEEIMHRALKIDPLSPILPVSFGRLYYYWRKYDEALQCLQPVIEKDPNFSPALLTLGNVYEALKESFRATSVLLKVAERNDIARQWALVGLGRIYSQTALEGEARKVLDELLGLAKINHVSPYTVAALYEALNETDKVFEWLERAYNERTNQLIHLKVDPHFDKLRGDLRFSNFLVRLNLL